MQADIVPIGNSKGIRIPKSVLDQCGFGTRVEIEVDENRLVVSPVDELRQGWDEAFEKMAARTDDVLIETPETAFDEDEWEW